MDDPLAVTPERMREMASATVELLVELIGDPGARPALNTGSAAELASRIESDAPEQGTPYEQVLGRLRDDVLPYTNSTAHPAYFAFIPGSGTFPGALGDLIASALNIEASSWLDAAGASKLELVVLDWFKSWIGYPPGAEGVLVSGGSAANLTALACARESLAQGMSEDLVIYASDQAHSSIARAARALGFRPGQLRVLPTDEEYRMRPDALAAAIEADRQAGLTPLAVCASAGSTNTGAIDRLAELAEISASAGAWLHVDGAYGGFAALTERGRGWLAGIERADSVTLDPHKWLYQPFECGCVLVRRGELLERAFRIAPDYLEDARGGEEGAAVSGSRRIPTGSGALVLAVAMVGSLDRASGVEAIEAPVPVRGESVVVAPATGEVLVTPPGTTEPAVLDAPRSVPVGTVIDASGGVTALTSAADGDAGTGTARLGGASFRVTQPARAGAYTKAAILGPWTSCFARSAGAARPSPGGRERRKRSGPRLRVASAGRFRVAGSKAVGFARRATWMVIDTCEETTIVRAIKGSVHARDRVRGRTVRLRAPAQYLAPGPKQGR